MSFSDMLSLTCLCLENICHLLHNVITFKHFVTYTFWRRCTTCWLVRAGLYLITQHSHALIVAFTQYLRSWPPVFPLLYFHPLHLLPLCTLPLGLLVRWAGWMPTTLQPLTCFSFTISRVVMPWPPHSCFTSCSLTLSALLLKFMRL